MKKLLIAGIVMVMSISSASAKTIPANYLHPTIQFFIAQNFGGLANVKKASVNTREFDVKLHTKVKMEFTHSGTLLEIESKYAPLPFAVLNYLPTQSISTYISTKYAGWKLVEVDTSSKYIEVELEQGRRDAKIKFNKVTGTIVKEKVDK